MRFSIIYLAIVTLAFFSSTTTYAASDIRPRFEGLVDKNLLAAWYRINKEAPGVPIEIMRESSPQSDKPITPGYVRIILDDKTGRVLYTPILQPN